MQDSVSVTMTPSWCREEVSEFFDRMDRDFDGRLSFGEFMGEETPLEKVFKNMDKDGDGSVSKEVIVIHFTPQSRDDLSYLQEFAKLCKHLTPQQVGRNLSKSFNNDEETSHSDLS